MLHSAGYIFRKANHSEKSICDSIRQQAWKKAYHHIYNQLEMDHYFCGKIKEKRTWPSLRFENESTIVCEIDGEIVAYASFGYNPSKEGELLSLYVLPQYWSQGIGSKLWNHILEICMKSQVHQFHIWVLEHARSSEFYMMKGCKKVHQGDYYIGDHIMETALCFAWDIRLKK